MKTSFSRGLAATSAVLLGLGITTFGAAPAFAATQSFKIESLTTDNPVSYDADPTAGDDDGYLALPGNVLLLDGQNEPYTYNLNDLTAVAASDAPSGNGEVFTDLATHTSYVLEIQNTGGDDFFDRALALDADGNVTSTTITFSEPIPEGTGGDWFAGNGHGEIGFWDSGSGVLYIVALPSGQVTTLNVSTFDDFTGVQPNTSSSENDSDLYLSGVLEYDCTAGYSLVMLDDNDGLGRFGLKDATYTELLANADGYADADTFIADPSNDRWYLHSENDGESSIFGINVTGMSEELISADMTWAASETCPTTPELPNTGVDGVAAGLWAACAALVALGGVAFVVIRRRNA